MAEEYYYVVTKRRHYYGRHSQRSAKIFPVSYGPFKTPAAATRWANKKGMLYWHISPAPAKENIVPEEEK